MLTQLPFVQQVRDHELERKAEDGFDERTAIHVNQHRRIGHADMQGLVVFGSQRFGCLLLSRGLLHTIMELAYRNAEQLRSLRLRNHVLGQCA